MTLTSDQHVVRLDVSEIEKKIWFSFEIAGGTAVAVRHGKVLNTASTVGKTLEKYTTSKTNYVGRRINILSII